jgi:thiol-disulfide isomerase/thioredoxin
MLMRTVGTHSATATRLPSKKVWHRRWLLLASIAAGALLVIALGVRFGVRGQSQHETSLVAVGIASVSPPQPVPPFAFADDAGHSLGLADFKGRAVVLNLWATWCIPCRQEMPSLDRLQAELGGPRFQVVAVSIDKQGAAVVQPFYRELGLRSLGIYLDSFGKAPSVLGIEGVPATLLIDSDSREIGRKLGVLDWGSPAVVGALRQAFGLAEMKPAARTTQEERKSP